MMYFIFKRLTILIFHILSVVYENDRFLILSVSFVLQLQAFKSVLMVVQYNLNNFKIIAKNLHKSYK